VHKVIYTILLNKAVVNAETCEALEIGPKCPICISDKHFVIVFNMNRCMDKSGFCKAYYQLLKAMKAFIFALM
jgi:hypothetical protein